MKLISQNPYRIIGLLSSASTREFEKQKSRIARFTSAGKEITSDYDFSFYGPVNRSEEDIADALSRIEQNHGKVNHALFWFAENGNDDKEALGFLIEGNVQEAINIWDQATTGRSVEATNFGSFNNYATLLLSLNKKEYFSKALALKFQLLESGYFQNFIGLVADENYLVPSEEQIKTTSAKIMKALQDEFSISGSEAMDYFSACSPKIQSLVGSKFTEDPQHNIENQISISKTGRKKKPEEAYASGLKLIENTKQDIITLRTVMGSEAVEFRMLSDRLAKEILQCGIDYFKALNEGSSPANKALELIREAKQLAVSDPVKDRINDNLSAIEEWSFGQPTEEENEKVGEEFEAVSKALEEFSPQKPSLQNAANLVVKCRAHLTKMGEELGQDNELYISLTSNVTNLALNMIIEVVNQEQDRIKRDHNRLNNLSASVDRSVKIMTALNKFKMNTKTRQRFNDNFSTIKGIQSQVRTAKSRKGGNDAVNVIRVVIGIIALFFILARACN